MRSEKTNMKMRGLKQIVDYFQQSLPSDGQLLASFVSRRDETAFAAMVCRHGQMVFGVCRRVLRHTQDAEDAFQATFVVLVRKAASLRRREAVGNWLYGVAYRTAWQARRRVTRTRGLEVQTMVEAVAPEDASLAAGEQLQMQA